ncbi:phage tail assembly protein [Salinicola avicenniae]|uniref:phage tail assembly protein n=1 Tax=Salinicola avicenniae TaxID=2916836 RepID=UPI002073E23B|nr:MULTISPECIES: phage tail assembly protein [unclassified Salinicola]
MVKPEIVIKLQEPIQHGSEEIRELVIRRPKARDFRRLPMEPAMGDMLNLAGDLAGQPPSVIDELDVADMLAVVQEVGKFMPDGPATGDSKSA